jgi:hypothetical protein
MKINFTAETQPLNDLSLKAANDSIMHAAAVVNAAVVQAAVQAWDPHEVWRTRILPYQRQQRLVSRASADKSVFDRSALEI